MLSTDFFDNFIQNTDILITLGNTNDENKRLKCTIAYNNTISRFLNHVFISTLDKERYAGGGSFNNFYFGTYCQN